MTKKDFELIAATLKSVKPHAPRGDLARDLWHETVGAFATMCRAQSPKFDTDRFLKACDAV